MIAEKKEVKNSNPKPSPETDKKHIIFNDLKKGDIRQGFFILKNPGGPYKNLEISVPDAGSFLKIIEKLPLNPQGSSEMPLKIFFEARARDWSKRYSDSIIIKMDNEEAKVTVELDTQTKPVNDFAHIIDPYYTRKIEYIIKKLESGTSVEIAVVTIESLEGKTIENYANDLFNEWKIGKEDKHNGILFLVDTCENKYRVEVGLGLEKLINTEFIHRLFDKIVIPNFKSREFGAGIYLTLQKIAEKIYVHQKTGKK